MRDEFEDIVEEFVSATEEKKRAAARSRRKRMGLWTKVFVFVAVLVTLASAVLAAMVLFTQTPTYTSTASLSMGCAVPAGTASGTLIVFTCPTAAAIYVASTATGFVSYTAFTVPSNVTDIYLIDSLATPSTACSSWFTAGDTNVNLVPAGGQVTIGTTPGRLQPGHSYDYCVDYSSMPPTFTFTVTWSQG